jgi:hypothetical protein
LWLIAAHSFLVGILLIIQPASLIKLMGFAQINERFFPCQGGVFHIILSLLYSFGAINPVKNRGMINFAIIIKLTAAMFLFYYYIIADNKMIILISGLGDLLMGLIICGALVYYSTSINNNGHNTLISHEN